MNKTIKLKVKHLIFIPLFIVVIFPNLLFLSAKLLFNNNGYIGKNLSKDYSFGLLKLYNNWPKIPNFTGETSYMMGKSVYNTSTKNINSYTIRDNSSPKVSIFGNSIRSDYTLRTIDDFKSSVKYLEEAINSLTGGLYYGKALIALTNLYLDGNEKEKAIELINTNIESEDEKVSLAANISKVSFLARTGEFKEALNLSKEINTKYDSLASESLYIDMLFLNGYIDEAKNLSGKNNYGDPYKSNKLSGLDKIFSEYCNEVDTFKSRFLLKNQGDWIKLSDDNNKLHGRLSYGGNPIPYQMVGIYKKGSFEGACSIITYTDENGYYEFTNLANENYSITANIPLYFLDQWTLPYINQSNINSVEINFESDNSIKEQNIDLVEKLKIENKTGDILSGDEYTLKWSKINNADSYNIAIHISGGNYNKYKNSQYGYFLEYINIKETEFTIPLVDGSIMSLPFYDTEVYGPKNQGMNYIGFVDGREITVGVLPIDKDGNVIQNDSYEMFTKTALTLMPKELHTNKGDMLMKEGKLDEAIDWYNNIIKEDGYKKEYIYPLLKNLCWKTILSEEDNIEFNNLIAELYKINGNKEEIELYKSIYDKGRNKNYKYDENK